jgi:hypothetical protein
VLACWSCAQPGHGDRCGGDWRCGQVRVGLSRMLLWSAKDHVGIESSRAAASVGHSGVLPQRQAQDARFSARCAGGAGQPPGQRRTQATRAGRAGDRWLPPCFCADPLRLASSLISQDENAGASSGDDSDKENSAAAAASAESAAKRRKTSLGGASSGSSSKGEASGSASASGIECASPGSPSCAKRPGPCALCHALCLQSHTPLSARLCAAAFLESGGSPSTPVADRRPLGSLSGNVPVSPA